MAAPPCAPGWPSRPAFPGIQNEANIRLLAGDLIDDATIVASLTAMRTELDELADLIAEGQALMTPCPTAPATCASPSLARRLVAAHREWLDEVEAELG